MTGYADYLFLLPPPQTIVDEVARYKKASAKYIGNFAGVNSPAHISLTQFERQKPFFAEGTLKKMEQDLLNVLPIVLHLDGFGYFNHLHDKKTIYAIIRNSKSVVDWIESMNKTLGIKKAILPHITICRNITNEQFNTLWPHFRHKKLVEPFWAKNLTIVSRDTYEPYSKWHTAKSIAFKRFKNNRSDKDGLDKSGQIDLF